MFREQVGTVSTWFDRWTPCEQTVAMVALLRRLQPTQARFLTAVLHRQLNDCGDVRRAEILANDPSFVASLTSSESKEALIRDLLAYLPLLNPKNSDVKALYLNLIPKVLKYTLDHSALMEEARQLLSYSLIHPAFTVEDRGLFATWLHQFEEKLNSTPTNTNNEGLNHYPSSLSGSPPSINEFGTWQTGTSPPNNHLNSLSGSPASQRGDSDYYWDSFCKLGGLIIGNFGGSNGHRIRRSNSLTPPVLHSDAWNSQEELCSSGKPRSLSLSSEVSPQSSLASSGSGSESHLDDPRPQFTNPGMKDVPMWLKSLRLHKYSFLFAHITFDEMMELSEESLEAQGVTKGARHKIVLSIAKLRDRVPHLKQIFEELTSDKESIRNALNEVKWVLTTPIMPNPLDNEDANTTPACIANNENTGPGNNGGGNVGPIGSNRYAEDKGGNGDGGNSEWQAVNHRNRDSDVNLPAWIVRVIGKACELNPDPECEGLLVSVLDKCLSHDVFSYKQKRLLSLWRQQQAPIARRNSIGHHGHFHSHLHRNNGNNGGNGGNGGVKHNRHFSPKVLSLGNQMGNSGGQSSTPSSWSPGSSMHAMFMAKRPSLQDSILESARNHLSVQRTKSAPLPNFFSSLSCSPPGLGSPFDHMTTTSVATSGTGTGTTTSAVGGPFGGLDFSSAGLMGGNASSADNNGGSLGTNTNSNSGTGVSSAMDITSRLESLCLSMTEAALGPAFNSY